MRIAVDMDEVLADAIWKELQIFNGRFDTNLTKDDLKGKIIPDIFPEKAAEFKSMFSNPYFFEDVPVIEGAKEALETLNRHHEVYVTSAAMEVPASFDAKYKWLAENLPFITSEQIVFCGNKTIICADYLIDDHRRHFENFSGQGILFTAPHNVYEEYEPRMNNWQEILNYFNL